jgi:hypothetical protein
VPSKGTRADQRRRLPRRQFAGRGRASLITGMGQPNGWQQASPVVKWRTKYQRSTGFP